MVNSIYVIVIVQDMVIINNKDIFQFPGEQQQNL